MQRQLIVLIGFCLTSGMCMASGKEVSEVAAESEAYCVQTGKDDPAPTPALIIQKVSEAAKLIEDKGEMAFPLFKGKGSQFIFGGTYVWIHDISGRMRMHPIKYKMEGRPLLNLRDRNGKLFFVEMNRTATAQGSGWVEYVWPKPGESETSNKTSYVKLAKHGDNTFIIGCGVYDWTIEGVQKALQE